MMMQILQENILKNILKTIVKNAHFSCAIIENNV